jgi:hypothetical protein
VEEEKVEEGEAMGGDSVQVDSDDDDDDLLPLLPREDHQFFREFVDFLAKLEAQPCAELRRRVRELWRIQAVESPAAAAAAAEPTRSAEDGRRLDREDAEEDQAAPLPPPPPRGEELVPVGAYDPEPGAYRIRTGRDPQRASLAYEDEEGPLGNDPEAANRRRPPRTYDQIYMAEANSVVENEALPPRHFWWKPSQSGASARSR